jgi:hypothetical protein
MILTRLIDFYRVAFLEAEDRDCMDSKDHLTCIKEHEMMESTHSSDADDEHCSQTSTSPGITLTPDVKCGPFKFPKSGSPKKSKTQTGVISATVTIKKEKENDDGFFSGFDVEEPMNEDMDTL